MFKAKILILGPVRAGKTTLSNFLSESTESGSGDYHPTQGCRILEFEQNGVQVNSRNVTAEVEMWDVSGDHKFESCWPAIARDTTGVIFVFNPDQPNHDKELESWYDYILPASGIRNDQCIIFAHRKPGSSGRDSIHLSPSMSRVTCIHTNLDDDGDTLRDEFQNFLSNLLTVMSEKREREELSIIQ